MRIACQVARALGRSLKSLICSAVPPSISGLSNLILYNIMFYTCFNLLYNWISITNNNGLDTDSMTVLAFGSSLLNETCT